MDIKLKDLLSCVSTFQTILIKNREEEFYPTYIDIQNYGEYYIRDVQADEDVLRISINEEI
ncbi:hypothetical protein ACFO6R_12625 [Eubacterium multiforme]|uniref:Uncharacterized protein n=1 Tax=Eubacterium multiforme TaxID=83339 RepID=A0ABT9UW78_9FIRM|nr:hypothetical protein [Eubacterium multiforme]MDQ0150586.1 hypothetical protein [Eubacterium multiforme]